LGAQNVNIVMLHCTNCDLLMNSIAKYVFDQLDNALIAQLRLDARTPVSKLAGIVGVSRGTVQNRLDRMTASGALLGFTIRVRKDYGFEVVRAVMMIEVVGKSTTYVIKILRGIPELHSLHTTNGKWDLVAEIHASSLSDFDRVLRDVRTTSGVSNSETSILLSTI
jgi:DNA-binding Lrp family transcriptional regulator